MIARACGGERSRRLFFSMFFSRRGGVVAGAGSHTLSKLWETVVACGPWAVRRPALSLQVTSGPPQRYSVYRLPLQAVFVTSDRAQTDTPTVLNAASHLAFRLSLGIGG